MRAEKRLWVYSGLAIPPGIGVVSKKITSVQEKPKKLLLVGNEHARGLVMYFSQLAMLDNVGFRAEIKLGSSPESWLKTNGMTPVIDSSVPTVVVMAFGVNDDDKTKELGKVAKDRGMSSILIVPSKENSVKFFASMASKVWNQHMRVK
jgi:hypothetical protein